MATAYILAVDDEPDLLGTLTRALGREGYELGQANSAIEAWQKIVYRRPDLLILDVMMPGMDGVALCRQLRADRRYVDLSVLLLTARNTTDDVVAGVGGGGGDYVLKTFLVAGVNARVPPPLRRGQRAGNRQ